LSTPLLTTIEIDPKVQTFPSFITKGTVLLIILHC